MYNKWSACNEPMITAMGRMCNHYVGCKKAEDIFEAEEVMDESNIYKWDGMSVV